MSTKKPWFLNQPAPVNYIAGLGRGATGFTTRSDIGPARNLEPVISSDGTENNVPIGAMLGQKRQRDVDADDEAEREATGRAVDETAMFASLPYEKDDAEADQEWEKIDERMDERRKARREKRQKLELQQYRKERPKIQQEFADLKPMLQKVSAEEWDAIQEVGDRSLKFKKTKAQTFTPVPDSLLARAQEETQYNSSISTSSGLQTPMYGGTVSSIRTPIINKDLTQMGEARKQMFNIKLQSRSNQISGQTVVNPKHYLTDLNSKQILSDMEIGDIKRVRKLLKSAIQTNPKRAEAWICATRLEEVAGKLAAAKKLINKACDHCPSSADVWLEAARLHSPEQAKSILARSIKYNTKSVEIWLQAATLEEDLAAKKKVYRKALEFLPTSPKIWKALVELEDEDDARIMLSRAVECVPHCVEMWLALARLETYQNARAVLNEARKKIPTNHTIWITAAQLEEANGNGDRCQKIIMRAIKILSSHQVVISREQWIEEAEKAEKANAILTCQAIINETIGLGLEPEDRKSTWMEDVDNCIKNSRYHTARAILVYASTVFPAKKSIWLRMAHFEKAHGTTESLQQLLDKAVKYCQQTAVLWLMSAKEKWLQGNVNGARLTLKEAFKANPNNEAIWLAAVKLENENNEPVRARALLTKARVAADTQRVWMKSAKLERELGNFEDERKLLDHALTKFQKYSKLWLMKVQLYERMYAMEDEKFNSTFAAGMKKPTTLDVRNLYREALKACPRSKPLWVCAARWEEKAFSIGSARSFLEKARLRNKNSPTLWLEAIRVELRGGNNEIANVLLAKALQECPSSGILWAQAIEMEQRARKRAKAVDALNKCDNDARVMLAVSKVFWQNRKLDKARNWLNRAVTLDPDFGDAWAAFFKFEVQHGDDESQQKIVDRCVEADPHHGEKWCSISKDDSNAHKSIEELLKKTALIV